MFVIRSGGRGIFFRFLYFFWGMGLFFCFFLRIFIVEGFCKVGVELVSRSMVTVGLGKGSRFEGLGFCEGFVLMAGLIIYYF